MSVENVRQNKVFLPVNVGLRVLFFFVSLKIKKGRAGSEKVKFS